MKTPLVLLHGWGVNSMIWHPALERLNVEFDLTLLDLPGYGSQIDYQGDYTLRAVVADVLGRAPDRAAWAGWSLGGTIALAAAIDHPDRFTKLQLISTTPCFLKRPQWETGIDSEPFEKIALQFEQDYSKAIKKFLLLQANTDDRTKIGKAKTVAREMSKLLLTVSAPSQKTLFGGLNLLKKTDLRPRLSELSVSAQVVAGAYDHVVPAAASAYLADHIPNCQDMCLLESGHLPFIETGTEYLRLLTSFAKSE